jgi:hypothetical protein
MYRVAVIFGGKAIEAIVLATDQRRVHATAAVDQFDLWSGLIRLKRIYNF